NPREDWLELQLNSDLFKSTGVCLGKCIFIPNDLIGTIVCAISQGVGRTYSSVPGTLIRSDLVSKVGCMPEHLRAGEDLLWRKQLRKVVGHDESGDGIIVYDSYEKSIFVTLKKWFKYASSVSEANLGKIQR